MRRLLPLVLALTAAAPLAAGAQARHGPALSAIDAQRRARARDLEADQARAEDVARDIARLRKQLVDLGQAEGEDERRAGTAKSQLLQLSAREAELKVRIGRNQAELSRLLGALQMYQRNPPPPLLVEPRSARDAVRAAILIKAITPEFERRSRAFAEQSRELARVRQQQAAAGGLLLTAENETADRRARIQDLIAQKRALEQQLSADAGAAGADVRRLAARARSMGELVWSLEARDGGAAGALPGRFVLPVRGVLARRFGETAPGHTRSGGWTWRTAPRALVLSPAEARVDYAGPLKGWGQVVILRLGGGYHAVLAGLDEVSAAAGRPVSAGEPIGRMGTGTAAPELYLEVRNASATVDPARWLEPPRRG